jgi:hypothetical protein
MSIGMPGGPDGFLGRGGEGFAQNTLPVLNKLSIKNTNRLI